MKLTLSMNIGAKDAKRLGLDKVLRGEVVTTTNKAAIDELRRRGLVIETTADAPATAVDFDAMTKEELKAYADDHGIEGVTTSLTKDETLKAVKKFNRVR